ncbi:FtsX-like permease family protein [Konateibacter massiliensis]|uniref:FtsX-like permease family protein n=1 Tax=Konateibacter massiliensis TaxID=2002841 RepID=UPI000C1537A1|nr:FtsX-like permease family protein [Konateibacter massiliensis]
MKSKTLWKDIKKCFLKSKGRFISIVCLIALGSFALVGLQVTGSNMRKTGEHYFEKLNLADICIIGDYGIDKENQKAINKVSGADKIEYGYLKDVVIQDTITSIRIFSDTEDLSVYDVVEGRLPETATEIAIADIYNADYQIGDTVAFTEKEDVSGETALKTHEFQIVGFVNSGEMLSIINMGQSTAGTGELQGYAVVDSSAFDYEVYMIARISFEDTKGVDPYSNEYTELIQNHKNELNELLVNQPTLRLSSIKEEYQDKIDEGQSEVDNAKKELADAEQELEDGEIELADAKQKYADGLDEYNKQKADANQQLDDAREELENGENELTDAKQKYTDGVAEYNKQKRNAEQQLSDAKAKLDDAAKQIADGESELTAKQQEFAKAESDLQEARAELNKGWNEYNEKSGKLEELKEAKAQLDAAQMQFEAGIAAAEAATGMTMAQIENALPSMKAQLDNLSAQYEMLSQLAALKVSRDAAVGTPEYDVLNQQYQAALQAANLSEQAADTLLAQLDNMQAQIVTAQTQYNQLAGLVETQNTLLQKWAEYNAAAEQAAGGEEQLAVAKQTLESGEEKYTAKSAELETARKQITKAEKKLASGKQSYQEGLAEYNSKKSEAETKLAAANAQLDEAAIKIADGEKKLADGWQEYYDKKEEADTKLTDAEAELAEGAAEIAEGERELVDGRQEYDEKKPDAEQEIEDAEAKLAGARETLKTLKLPIYTLDTRREVPGSEGYRIYNSVSTIIDALADIFPIFLYFVAALVTLTTMTRFVDEERINSGTLKALGYSNKDIIKKFIVYGFCASSIGAAIGIVAGHTVLPMIVYNAYGHSFSIPQIELYFYPGITVIAILLAFVSAVVPAYIVAARELKEKPSALLQPKPPEAGSKIFLERISQIWNRMSFTHKVTARNIFRYKKRMLMTIFGVCGSVTLIFAGFSVQHSISGINDRQFGKIIQYDLIVAKNDNLNEEKTNEIDQLLASNEVNQQLPILYDEMTKIAGDNQDKQEIKLIVPEDAEAFKDYISLVNRSTGEELELSKDGAVISERLAKLLDVKIGDTITVTDSENYERKMMISNITEMYTGHFIFMDMDYYQTVFATTYSSNANMVTLDDRSIENANEQASEFVNLDGVKGVVQNTTMKNQINTIVQSLKMIMQVLIIVAVLLAVVILYNLTNINVSERIRELSTIKVLGFYNKEVTLYIYRETILLTLLGVLAGFGLGDALYLYIISVVPPDEVMFNPALGVKAFLIPVLVVCMITVVLGAIINHRLKNVNMLEALKSVE